ncbi:WhiB family transcriptional regulator [Streptomyces sp. NPDC057253]|uniref:WhiB family transcriptional regulator n=1 Tax=Streptomyces sp. NPDC057253 TaxID=3346069 RepID=UPI00363D1754
MDREWELQAACRSMDPDVFFSQKTIGLAKQTCKGCPVQMECLEAALVREDGVPKAFRIGLVANTTGAQRWSIEQQRKAAAAAPQPPKKKPAGRPRSKSGPECGTPAAYQRHLRYGEPVDQACKDANAASRRQYRRTGSTKVSASC